MSFNPRCRKCGTENPLNFSKGGRSNHGVQPFCKACTKPRQALYRKLRQKKKSWQQECQEKGQMVLFN